MANIELKIEDDYIKDQAQLIGEWANDLQEGIDKYITIMNHIIEEAIMEGTTAEALSTFVYYVENLKEIVKEMGTEAKGMGLSFLNEVDKADDYLY